MVPTSQPQTDAQSRDPAPHSPAWGDPDLAAALHRLRQEPAVCLRVQRAEGSVPREAGAWMLVFAEGEAGTIGGGQLEWQATQWARGLWQAAHGAGGAARAEAGAAPDEGPEPALRRFALGPSLGQCCGGAVWLSAQAVGAADADRLAALLAPTRWPVALFGGGHVGQAIVQALLPLPFALHWIDSRDGIFPPGLPAWVRTEHSDPVQRAVHDLAPGSAVLVMSFSHAEDLDIVAACLDRLAERDDLGFVGLIGSQTKWATFSHRLQARGYGDARIARVTCPIGLPGIAGKEPAVIAASVAAQLLLQRPR